MFATRPYRRFVDDHPTPVRRPATPLARYGAMGKARVASGYATASDLHHPLGHDQYFWVDIARDGIALYELSGSALATPKPLTAAEAYIVANRYFTDWLPAIDRALRTVEFQVGEGSADPKWRKDAAFMLHQAFERAYTCFLLSRTQYVPRSHNLKFLRSLAEDKEPRLIDSWPRATKIDRRRFELAKRAYVEARYSASYEIGADDLTAITAAAHKLRDAVASVSREWLEEVRQKAGL